MGVQNETGKIVHVSEKRDFVPNRMGKGHSQSSSDQWSKLHASQSRCKLLAVWESVQTPMTAKESVTRTLHVPSSALDKGVHDSLYCLGQKRPYEWRS